MDYSARRARDERSGLSVGRRLWKRYEGVRDIIIRVSGVRVPPPASNKHGARATIGSRREAEIRLGGTEVAPSGYFYFTVAAPVT
jgi:hypothetical protein